MIGGCLFYLLLFVVYCGLYCLLFVAYGQVNWLLSLLVVVDVLLLKVLVSVSCYC